MNPDELKSEMDLFNELLEQPEEAQEAFIDARCEDVAERLRNLLIGHQLAGHTAGTEGIAKQDTVQMPSEIDSFRLISKLGEGGMGVVYVAEQTQPVRRQVAIKLVKSGVDSEEVIARFHAERQALALMNHKNIAQILDGGVFKGRPYFVMELIAGIPITEYCDRRALSVADRLRLFVEVCQGVQHAHQKGVIHRDLKPSNVLVAEEDGVASPKIIDFGIAKAVTNRLLEATVHTEMGRIIGTPDYMCPEQADISALDIDTRADVYSLGAMLYELLSGCTVFGLAERRAGLDEIRNAIAMQDPIRPSARMMQDQPLVNERARYRSSEPDSLARLLRQDLDWITLRSLERDRVRRYASASELAADVSRFLRQEPVVARPPSTSYRVSKFVRRHKVMISATVLVFAALVVGAIVSTTQYFHAESERVRADDLRRESDKARAAEEVQRRRAERQYEEIIRLADLKRLADARATSEKLWPAHSENVEAMEAWLAKRAAPLQENLQRHEATLASLRNQASEYDAEQQRYDRETHPRVGELAKEKAKLLRLNDELDAVRIVNGERQTDVNAELIEGLQESIAQAEKAIAELAKTVEERRTWRLPNEETQWQHDMLVGLVRDLQLFTNTDAITGTVASVEARLRFARTVEKKSVSGPRVAARWDEAIANIAQLEIYHGLELNPQLGLVPLRRDPHSGLWEFGHIQTGTQPQVDSKNAWRMTAETGLVFVLVPGGKFWMGAQKDDPTGRNYDPQADSNQGPVHEIDLDPFFVSKYEMTQSQWHRFTGVNPSNYDSSWIWKGNPPADRPICVNTPWNPVENLSWLECKEVLGRLDLVLPTEAQWEYAARAGTETPWWSGDKRESIGIHRAGNLADGWTRAKGGPATWPYEDWEDYRIVHGPVGECKPNAFGLHDTIGNVWEWCLDAHVSYDEVITRGDGLRSATGDEFRIFRGGSFGNPASQARSAFRNSNAPGHHNVNHGVRPARIISE
jgi:formylglycine-generating enzyme required for sulfatase activity/serine/threonine protein kinase